MSIKKHTFFLTHKDSFVRQKGIEMLGDQRKRDAAEEIGERLMLDESMEIRIQSAATLGDLQIRHAYVELRRAVKFETVWEVREAIIEAIARYTAVEVLELLEALNERADDKRETRQLSGHIKRLARDLKRSKNQPEKVA